MGKIEAMFEEFIAQADQFVVPNKESRTMIKALYFTAIGHFLMTKGDFILMEKNGKKLIEHMTMIEEIKDFMMGLRDEMEKHKPQEPHEKH